MYMLRLARFDGCRRRVFVSALQLPEVPRASNEVVMRSRLLPVPLAAGLDVPARGGRWNCTRGRQEAPRLVRSRDGQRKVVRCASPRAHTSDRSRKRRCEVRYELSVPREMNDGLVRLESSLYGIQMWTRRKLRRSFHRKQWSARFAKSMQPGDVAYGPLTNGYNRMVRICEACIERMSK